LTNKHVINDADQIIVALQDGRVFEALLVGSDSLTDLAVLKINATGGLPVIPINPKRTPHIGDVVLAIGNPYNLGQTITQGIISATGRIGLNPTGRQNFLQTDASINHGNSGGALVNSLGELMGINTLSFDKSNDGETPEGIGFAIPFQLATKIMDKLIRDGRVIRGYIGISGREIAPLHAQGGGIDQIQGIVVNDVAPDGPAAQAGIRANDVIISVNDKPAVSALETMDQVAEIRPGSEIPVVIMRDDKKITLH
ncbi:outer membrane-stress sensor serine endopeptidase DegS, partial [Klebsiella pneumoniae]